jgi:hypothetical protein
VDKDQNFTQFKINLILDSSQGEETMWHTNLPTIPFFLFSGDRLFSRKTKYPQERGNSIYQQTIYAQKTTPCQLTTIVSKKNHLSSCHMLLLYSFADKIIFIIRRVGVLSVAVNSFSDYFSVQGGNTKFRDIAGKETELRITPQVIGVTKEFRG